MRVSPLAFALALTGLILAGCVTPGADGSRACLNYQVLERDASDPNVLLVAATLGNEGARGALEADRIRLVLNLTETTTGNVTSLPLEWGGDDVPTGQLRQQVYRLTPPANGTAYRLGGHLEYEGTVTPAAASCKGYA